MLTYLHRLFNKEVAGRQGYKVIIALLPIILALAPLQRTQAQCGYAVGLGCANTDYNNFGYNSTSDFTTLEYDNYVSGYHQTVARTFTGDFMIWGHYTASDGVNSVLSPQSINAINYPGLTGTVLKATIGSYGYSNQQTIVLTTTGLFALGKPGVVLTTDIVNTPVFSKLTINGFDDGLPPGVSPKDVKMMFATHVTLVITTCSGEVWVLSQTSAMRGNNSNGNARVWHRPLISTTGPVRLTDVVAVRGSCSAMMALRRDNTVWVWGTQTYLGDGSPAMKREVATQMVLPKAGTIKMIGSTSDGPRSSFYILYTDGSLYSVGNNAKKQLGDWTTVERTTWVQPRYNSVSGPRMNNIKWISPMEHDRKYPSIAVINNDMKLYNWGHEEGHDLGRGNMSATPVDPGIPLGLTPADQILSVESGGHTTMFTEKCHENFGYVGHRIYGSMGNGSTVNTYESNINYNTAYVPICGAMNTPVIGAWVINIEGDVCDKATILLDPSPAGGTLSVVSGPGVLQGHELTFTGIGPVELEYLVEADCGMKTVKRTFDVKSCFIYKISGTVWVDFNEDAIRDAGEPGTNTGTKLTDGVWANLVDQNGQVMQSIPVNLDGTYEFYTRDAGTYSVRITNEQIGIGSAIATPSRKLPADWKYTGHHFGWPCVVPACVNPDIIEGVTVNAANREVHDLDFGLTGPVILKTPLLNFNANLSGDVAILKWTTSSESNNRGFEIQRSRDGIQWIVIGFAGSAAAGGNSAQLTSYNFTDLTPARGVNYYRLKQIAQDGGFVYSKTTTVLFNPQNNRLVVWPNPTQGMFQIRGLTGNETIRIIDPSGREIENRKAKQVLEKFDVARYATGIYQVIVLHDNQRRSVFQVIKRD